MNKLPIKSCSFFAVIHTLAERSVRWNWIGGGVIVGVFLPVILALRGFVLPTPPPSGALLRRLRPYGYGSAPRWNLLDELE